MHVLQGPKFGFWPTYNRAVFLFQLGAPSCKDFYALDIGAGNYQWGRKLAQYLNAKTNLPKDVTRHIIGIRGETNLDEAVTKVGQCTLYEFGQFQVETLSDEFTKQGLQLANKVDLVVSSRCFRHLVDPVGTFVFGKVNTVAIRVYSNV